MEAEGSLLLFFVSASNLANCNELNSQRYQVGLQPFLPDSWLFSILSCLDIDLLLPALDNSVQRCIMSSVCCDTITAGKWNGLTNWHKKLTTRFREIFEKASTRALSCWKCLHFYNEEHLVGDFSEYCFAESRFQLNWDNTWLAEDGLKCHLEPATI